MNQKTYAQMLNAFVALTADEQAYMIDVYTEIHKLRADAEEKKIIED